MLEPWKRGPKGEVGDIWVLIMIQVQSLLLMGFWNQTLHFYGILEGLNLSEMVAETGIGSVRKQSYPLRICLHGSALTQVWILSMNSLLGAGNPTPRN